MATWWREPDVEAAGAGGGAGGGAGAGAECAAARAWRGACAALCAADAERAWRLVAAASPPHDIWHSLPNCVAYQAGVWQALVSRGAADAVQPAGFRLALALRHSPRDLAARLLPDLLRRHPHSQDLTSYILALLTEDEAPAPACPAGPAPASPAGPAPARDLQLFGDCELAVLAAGPARYDAHARLVRAEYSHMSQGKFLELRIKVLNQLSKIPKLYHTPEFEPLEAAAKENIKREISNLKEQLQEAETL